METWGLMLALGIMLIFTMLLMLYTMLTHRWMGILATETICACAMMVFEYMRMMDARVKWVVSVIGVLAVVLWRILFPPVNLSTVEMQSFMDYRRWSI